MILTALLALVCSAGLTTDPAPSADLQGLLPTSFAPPVAAQERHGRVKWFQGSYEELLATAARERRVVLLNFYTDLCSYCLVLDSEAYSDSTVVEALAPALCFSIDAKSDAGRALAARFWIVNHFPAVVFLDADGELRDRIIGYLPTRLFLPEVQRILRDESTLGDLRRKVAKQPTNVDAIWSLAKKLESLGDLDACTAEIQRIRELDPEGSSRPMHHLAMRAVIEKVALEGDDEPLRKLLTRETYPELLFEGWNQIAFHDLMKAKKAGMQGLDDLARQHKRAYHQSHLKAWPSCPRDQVADYGNHVAWELYLDWANIDSEMRRSAISVAREAAGAAPKAPEILDTLACLLFNDGQLDEAVRLMLKCIRLEPDRDLWEERLEMFQAKES